MRAYEICEDLTDPTTTKRKNDRTGNMKVFTDSIPSRWALETQPLAG